MIEIVSAGTGDTDTPLVCASCKELYIKKRTPLILQRSVRL